MCAIPFLLCRGQFTLRLLQHVTCSLSFPASFFLPGWDAGLIWILPPVIRYYSGLVGREEGSPCVSDLETGYIIEFGPSQGKRNASHLHQITSNWGGAGRTTLR